MHIAQLSAGKSTEDIFSKNKYFNPMTTKLLKEKDIFSFSPKTLENNDLTSSNNFKRNSTPSNFSNCNNLKKE